MLRALPLLRLANPVVRVVLSSRAHRLLDRSLLVLGYRGRRSGRAFRIPVRYARHGERVLVVAVRPDAKQWWRTFRGGAPATLTLEGTEVPALGRLLTGADAERALRAYATRFPRSARVLRGSVAVVELTPDRAALEEAA